MRELRTSGSVGGRRSDLAVYPTTRDAATTRRFHGAGTRVWHVLAEWADRLSEHEGATREKSRFEIEDAFLTAELVTRRYNPDGTPVRRRP